ncbi:peptidoglycan editing factor PgeF [Lentibacter algarum]|uniref:peptidoglycan editing factor PgeF n=1 Tax=Lentibacter algarum TaxID=576131 RepID=UPI001C0666D1|nr:peptidoglycan editing factor PgeF [Lentibacter algarum]MBU2981727.1 peptidoglycan editing factor PgeF [Lentibacter algarum]
MALEILTDDSLAPLKHGFFTRKGGASSGIYAGLNCGHGSSDLTSAVTINRARVAAALDLTPEVLVSVHQVHSPDVVHVTSPIAEKPMADAMVTAQAGLGLAILTADCQPVLFADHDAGVIGAAHAGWKGAQGGVLEATVDAMEALGAKAANISAVIGPCISQRSYEVGQEFVERFLDEDLDNNRFFISGRDEGKYLFDLAGFGLSRLRARGVGNTSWTGHCTYEDAARFYSYRRTTHNKEQDYGRLIAVIRL